MNIETISNGWIVTDGTERKSFHDFEELLRHLLLVLDGKSESFGGSMYAKLTISYKDPKGLK